MIDGCSDEDLLCLLKKGDNQAFGEIFNRYWKPLLYVAAKKLGNIDEAEDVVQEIFVSIWSRREVLEISTSLNHYLAVSVKYRVSRLLAARLKKDTLDDNLAASGSGYFSAHDGLEFEQLETRLAHIVASLPEKCQLVYQLSRESGYSHRKISQTLNISEKTVEAHISKALKAIKRGINGLLLSLF